MMMEERKAELRMAVRHRRRQSDAVEALARKSISVQEKFIASFPPRAGMKIALYKAVRDEVDTAHIHRICIDAGALLFYPRVMEEGKLFFYRFVDGDGWVRGKFGNPEPEVSSGKKGIQRGFDLVVVPGVAFDRRGSRLGRGCGYYDRFLSGLGGTAVTAGLAFSGQIVKEVPVDTWDIPVDVVVTEDGVIPGSGWRPKGAHIK
jgi:5-formyltetrahydrofolate cyclo-ligase